jgi:hypothetical protein
MERIDIAELNNDYEQILYEAGFGEFEKSPEKEKWVNLKTKQVIIVTHEKKDGVVWTNFEEAN